MLKTEHLYREFKRGKEKFYAVNDLNIEIKKGELITVIGHSGGGKSTFFHMLTGMIRPTSGSILFEGKDLAKISPAEFSKLRGTKIAYIMQGQNLLPNFTVLENVCLPSSLNKLPVDKEKAMKLLSQFGVEQFAMEYPGKLSGGEQRRVAIARAFMQDPHLVIADEPTSSLDPENSKIIMEFFRKVSREGVTVLISTHDVEFVEYADRCFHMEKGTLREN